MPKYGIHHIVLKEAATQLAVSPHPAAAAASGIIMVNFPPLSSARSVRTSFSGDRTMKSSTRFIVFTATLKR